MNRKHNSQRQQGDARNEARRSSAPSANDETAHQSPDSANATSKSGDNKDDAKDRQFRKVNMVLMLVFTGALVVVNIVYAYFAGGQWTAMDKSLTEIRNNRELEYRAYVGAKIALFQQRTDNPAWADVTLVTVNTGRTHVKDAQIRKVLEPRNEPPPNDAPVNDTTASSKIAYLPNIEYSTYMGALQTHVADILKAQATLGATATPTPQPRPKGSPTPPLVVPNLNPPEMPDFFGPGYYLYGIIDYKDIFDRPHWTKFCFHIAPRTSAFTLCPTFNDSN